MSYAEEVKNEAARYTEDDIGCLKVELAALLYMGGSILLGAGQTVGFSFSTANNAVARRVLSMWKQCFEVVPTVMVRRGQKLRKKNIYTLRVLPSVEAKASLEALGVFPVSDGLKKIDLQTSASKRALLRGAFLGGGSVNQPKGDYHLELVTGNISFAELLLKTIRQFKIGAKITDRKGDYLVYIKDGNGITAFLQRIGAVKAYLEFENVRVVKEMRNNVNRIVNCETANLQKTVEAAVRQVHQIEVIQRYYGLEQLPMKLKEAAQLRLQYPEAPLGELVELMNGTLSKSGLNHRFKKLADLAHELECQYGAVLNEEGKEE